MWFRAFSDVAYYFLPKGGIKTKIMILFAITALLYLGDGSLDELYKFDHPEAVAGVVGSHDDEDRNAQVRKLNRRAPPPRPKH